MGDAPSIGSVDETSGGASDRMPDEASDAMRAPLVGRGGRPLRVLHVGKFYPPHRGGMETHLEALCTRLMGHVDVRVLVSADGRRTVREVVDGVPVTRVGTLAGVASAALNPGLAREIREGEADVVHLHHPNPTATLSYLASGHRGPLVVTYHSDVVRQRVLGALFRPVLERLMGRASAVLVSSPNYLAGSPVLRRHASRCRVVPFGVEPAEFERFDARARDAVRERYGPRMVLGVGRLVYYKGFQYLVSAMEGLDAHLVLAGDGPERPALERLAARPGIAGRVSLVGSVPDLLPYYHAASVFALPAVARSEAFGLVQLEAMACGLPVVNTSIDSGVPFVSVNGQTGITVPPASAPALAAALRALLDDAALRRRMGLAARRRVRDEFSVDRMVARTLDVYADVGRAAAPASPAAATG
jgi:glycosyltransferase involved in cell wall biosynthesis